MEKTRIRKLEERVASREAPAVVVGWCVYVPDEDIEKYRGEENLLLALPDGTFVEASTGRRLTKRDLRDEGVIVLEWQDGTG